jgi:dihydrofolate synthase/folylpolyglutamate synthase
MGFLLFRQLEITRAVIEVGLGGRLDATNVIEPELSVITPIDFDHEQFLGSSLELIAGEKAGILKASRPAVFAQQRQEAAHVLASRAAALGIQPVWNSEYCVRDVNLRPDGAEFTAARGSHALHVSCPLAGAHQVTNALTAAVTLDCLNVPVDGIADTRWSGRLQRISANPDIVLDGAHNPAGARALAEHIVRFYSGRNIWLVYGAMRDKSVEEITEILFPLAAHVILTAPASPRAVRPEALARTASHPHVLVIPGAAEALAFARSVPERDAVFVTGSLYLVGEILALLQ